MTSFPPAKGHSWWKRLNEKSPRVKANISLNPSVTLTASHAAQEREALRHLCIELSKRKVLWAGVELELPGECAASAEGAIREAERAREALPSSSKFDESVEWLQDACNGFMSDLRERQAETWPFGDSLYEFRCLVLEWADWIAEETNLDEAKRLAAKIDLHNARQPMGEETRTIHVVPEDDPIPPAPS